MDSILNLGAALGILIGTMVALVVLVALKASSVRTAAPEKPGAAPAKSQPMRLRNMAMPAVVRPVTPGMSEVIGLN